MVIHDPNPAEWTMVVFIAFYDTGRVAQVQVTAHIYDPVLLQAAQEARVGF